MFVRTDIVFNFRADIYDEELEAVWLDIIVPILVRVGYRHPEQKHFYELLEDICAKSVTNSEAIIFG